MNDAAFYAGFGLRDTYKFYFPRAGTNPDLLRGLRTIYCEHN